MAGLGEGQRMVEFTLLENLKFDNIIVDTLIKGLIITITGAVFLKFKDVAADWKYYLDRILGFFGWRTNKLTIKWKVNKTAQQEVNNSSRKFEAILHKVMKLEHKDAGVCDLLENPNPESLSFIVNQTLPFTFEPGVYGKIKSVNSGWDFQQMTGGRTILVSDTFVAEIYSRNKSLAQLMKLLDQWMKEYEEFGLKTNKIIVKWRVNKRSYNGDKANSSEAIKSFDTDKKASQMAGMEATNSSKRFEAILHQVMKLKYDQAGISTLREAPESFSFMVAQEPPFEFSPGVFGRIQFDKIVDKERMEDVGEIFNAEIYSNTKTLRELQDLLEDWVEEYESHERKTGWNELKFYGNLKNGRQFNFSVKLLSILHHLEKKGVTNPSIKVLKEFAVEEEKQFGREDEIMTKKKEQLIPETIEVEKDIFCKVTCGSWGNQRGQDPSEVQVKVYSKKLKVPQLVALVKQWEKEYEEFNQLGQGLRYFVFNPPPQDKQSNSGLPTNYTEFSFESGKTFKNIFFPEKEKLIKKINFFLENESWYSQHGTPYMFGLLLHGEPGCGKTSTIKAIANMTQRHIVSVPLKNVKTISDLYNALYGGKINKSSIPMKKRLYVLEDIDCAGLDDIMKKRVAEPQKPAEINPNENNENKNPEPKVEEKTEIKLSDLLEAFDGVLEMNGRMMVMTTNHLEKLDPALIRPGRVNLSLEFKRCTKQAIGEFFETFFPNIPLDMENVQDGVWTPAEVAQICINHQDDVDLAIQKIYERKFIPNDTKNEGQDEKIEEAMSDYGSDIVESRILDSNNQ